MQGVESTAICVPVWVIKVKIVQKKEEKLKGSPENWNMYHRTARKYLCFVTSFLCKLSKRIIFWSTLATYLNCIFSHFPLPCSCARSLRCVRTCALPEYDGNAQVGGAYAHNMGVKHSWSMSQGDSNSGSGSTERYLLRSQEPVISSSVFSSSPTSAREKPLRKQQNRRGKLPNQPQPGASLSALRWDICPSVGAPFRSMNPAAASWGVRSVFCIRSLLTWRRPLTNKCLFRAFRPVTAEKRLLFMWGKCHFCDLTARVS